MFGGIRTLFARNFVQLTPVLTPSFLDVHFCHNTTWGTMDFSCYVDWVFSCVKTWNRPEIYVKSWFAIPGAIGKFSPFHSGICKKCHLQSLNRDADTIFFLLFHHLYLEICDTESWNQPFHSGKTWNAPCICFPSSTSIVHQANCQ